MAQMVKNLPAVQDTQVQSLGQEDPLDGAWQLTPGFLPGETHRQRNLAGYSPSGCKELDMTSDLTHTYTHGITNCITMDSKTKG